MSPILDALLDWIETPDWGASAAYIREHPELLSDQAMQVLAQLLSSAQVSRNTSMARECLRHYALLTLVRREGIEEAYARLLSSRSSE